VLGLIYEAKRAEARVVAFVRDSDGDVDRPGVIAEAIGKAQQEFPDVDVIGGTAIPVLESWVLAMLGERKTENLGKAAAQAKVVEKGIAAKDTSAMARAAADFSLDGLPEDAASLRAWLARARQVLPPAVSAAS